MCSREVVWVSSRVVRARGSFVCSVCRAMEESPPQELSQVLPPVQPTETAPSHSVPAAASAASGNGSTYHTHTGIGTENEPIVNVFVSRIMTVTKITAAIFLITRKSIRPRVFPDRYITVIYP